MTTTESLILAVLSATDERKEAILRMLRGDANSRHPIEGHTLAKSPSKSQERPENLTVKSGFVSKRAAANYCSLSPRSLDYARERGDLPYHKVGKKVVFQMKDLEDFMKRYRVAV